jgi:hypothetical protein
LANPFILFKTMNKFFHVIYYPLYMLIMQVSHNPGHMRGSNHMPESDHMLDSDLKI